MLKITYFKRITFLYAINCLNLILENPFNQKDMTKIKVILILFLTCIVVSCKKNDCKTVKLVKDCTGTYLNIDGKDYQVCNVEKTAKFEDGAEVKVKYRKLSECSGSANDMIVCMMNHANEGWIEIDWIK